MINMFRSILCALLTIFVLSSASDTPKTGWEKDGLSGRVKTAKHYSIKQNGRRVVKDKLRTFYFYDINGNKVEQCNYTEDGKLCSKYVYKFDDKGNMIEECDYDSIANLEYKETYKFDTKGNCIETCIYGLKLYDSVVYGVYDAFKKEKRKYRDDGKLIEEVSFYDSRADSTLLEIFGEAVAEDLKPLDYINREDDKDFQESYDILSQIETYKYDEKGNLIEFSTYWRNSSLHFKLVYKYDENNNKIAELKYDSDSLLFERRYKYDINNKVVEEYYYSDDGHVNYFITRYDINGNIEEYDSYEDGVFQRKDKYKYDANGKKVEECGYRNDSTLIYKYAYKYNKLGKRIAEYSGFDRYPVERGSELEKKVDWKYNKEGKLIRIRDYEGVTYYKNKYDNCGNMIMNIKETWNKVDGTITEYEYY